MIYVWFVPKCDTSMVRIILDPSLQWVLKRFASLYSFAFYLGWYMLIPWKKYTCFEGPSEAASPLTWSGANCKRRQSSATEERLCLLPTSSCLLKQSRGYFYLPATISWITSYHIPISWATGRNGGGCIHKLQEIQGDSGNKMNKWLVVGTCN